MEGNEDVLIGMENDQNIFTIGEEDYNVYTTAKMTMMSTWPGEMIWILPQSQKTTTVSTWPWGTGDIRDFTTIKGDIDKVFMTTGDNDDDSVTEEIFRIVQWSQKTLSPPLQEMR